MPTKPLQAGFAQIDITPHPGSRKIGWLKEVIGESILDPLYARAAVLSAGRQPIGFIQLDLLSIRWTQVNRIRQRIRDQHGFPAERILVAATHNHAGPAVAAAGDVKRDEAYVKLLEDRCAAVFADALRRVDAAEFGLDSSIETGLAFNRRMIMRDGTVRTQVSMTPEALCPEGPADPEVGLLAVRDKERNLKGCIVNFACHPVHHGGEPVFFSRLSGSAGPNPASPRLPRHLVSQGRLGQHYYF